jgi:hypothetical protein
MENNEVDAPAATETVVIAGVIRPFETSSAKCVRNEEVNRLRDQLGDCYGP